MRFSLALVVGSVGSAAALHFPNPPPSPPPVPPPPDCDIVPECKAGVAVYVDEIDGDYKQITISKDGDKKDWYLTIEPYNSTEVWIVTTTIDVKTCMANVDFNVTGKPNPPPVNLTMTIHTLALRHPCTTNLAAIFTDPTGYLNPIGIPGSADFPLNTWIQIPASLD